MVKLPIVMSNPREICAQLRVVPRLRPAPTDLLRLCAEFCVIPPFRNEVVRTFRPSQSARGLAVACYRRDYYVSVGNQIHVISQAGELIRKWDLTDSIPKDVVQDSEALRNFPHSLCVVDDRVYVACRCDNAVHVYDTLGYLICRWNIQGKIDGIAVHQGDVFVSDLAWHCVVVYNTDGTLLRQIGAMGSDKKKLYGPSGLLVTSLGELWVADWKNGNIQAFHPQGTFLRTICTNLTTPWNLVERGDQILISSIHSLSVFALEGKLIGVFPIQDMSVTIHGMCVNEDGYLVTADKSHIYILE